MPRSSAIPRRTPCPAFSCRRRPDPGNGGWRRGERAASEGNIDPYFFGSATLAYATEGAETKTHLEEAYIATTSRCRMASPSKAGASTRASVTSTSSIATPTTSPTGRCRTAPCSPTAAATRGCTPTTVCKFDGSRRPKRFSSLGRNCSGESFPAGARGATARGAHGVRAHRR